MSQYSELTYENVEALAPNVQKFDEDEENGLSLYCYVNSDEFHKGVNPLVKECRGVVFHNKQLILQAFSYTPEYLSTSPAKLENILKNMNEWQFFEAYEGTLLRLFFFGKRWFLATHKKLDAFHSKWASRISFGTLFRYGLEYDEKHVKKFSERLSKSNGETTLDRFYDTLDKKYQYMFLVRSTAENRIVCNAPERPQVFHVGTFINKELNLDIDIDIEKPKKLEFKDHKELTDYVAVLEPENLPGVICFGPNNTQIKVINHCYDYWFKLRGNQPSIKFRYLQIRHDEILRKDFSLLYPEYQDQFDECEKDILDFAESLLSMYKKKYIDKSLNFEQLPPAEHKILKNCHNSFNMDKRNKISLAKVLEQINQSYPTDINHMLKRWKNAKNSDKEFVSLLSQNYESD